MPCRRSVSYTHLDVYKRQGHMGVETVTIQNLEVAKVDLDKNVILVKGSVPGAKGAVLKIKSSVKSK